MPSLRAGGEAISGKVDIIDLAPAGSPVLKKGNATVTIKGIYDVGAVAENIRGKTDATYR